MRSIRTKVLVAITAAALGVGMAMAVAQTSTGAPGPRAAAADDYYVPTDDYYVPTDDYYTLPTQGTTTGGGGGGGNGGGGNGGGGNGGGGNGGGNGNGNGNNNNGGKKNNKNRKKKNRKKNKKNKNDKKIKVNGNVKKSGIGKARLGDDQDQIEDDLGKPKRSKGDELTYDTKGNDTLLIGLDKKDSAYVGTDSTKPKLQSTRVDDTEAEAVADLGTKANRKGDLLLLKKGKRVFVVGLGGGKVKVVGVADKKLSDNKIKKFVKKTD